MQQQSINFFFSTQKISIFFFFPSIELEMIYVDSAEDEIAIAEQFQVVCVIFFLYLIPSSSSSLFIVQQPNRVLEMNQDMENQKPIVASAPPRADVIEQFVLELFKSNI